MIYYNSQLMGTPLKATLYMTDNPTSFTRYEDHQAAIYFRLHQLIEQAMASGENPISLLEDYLETIYTDGKTVEEISSFLYHNDKMQLALWALKDSWSMLDPTLPDTSLLYGGMSKQEALQLYAEITLRSFLEALAAYK